MNFSSAIATHSGWKAKLAAYVTKPDGSLRTGDVGSDSQCELGKWIYGDGGAQFGSSPEFAELKRVHARFHTSAAEVVRKADLGQHVTDELALGAKSDFGTASTAVVTVLMKLHSMFAK